MPFGYSVCACASVCAPIAVFLCVCSCVCVCQVKEEEGFLVEVSLEGRVASRAFLSVAVVVNPASTSPPHPPPPSPPQDPLPSNVCMHTKCCCSLLALTWPLQKPFILSSSLVLLCSSSSLLLSFSPPLFMFSPPHHLLPLLLLLQLFISLSPSHSSPLAVSDPFKIFESVFGGGGGGSGDSAFNFFGGGGGGGNPFQGAGGGRQRQQQQQQRAPRPSLYKDVPFVKELGRTDFKRTVGKEFRGNTTWLLHLYSPDCPHCQAMVPDITRLAKALRGVVSVGVVNCAAEEKICSG